MGGCDIDLEGGEYRISQPLLLPPMNANMQFGRGSLVATKDFKGDFLFVVGEQGGCKVPQGSCNIDVNFPEVCLCAFVCVCVCVCVCVFVYVYVCLLRCIFNAQ